MGPHAKLYFHTNDHHYHHHSTMIIWYLLSQELHWDMSKATHSERLL